VPRSSRLFVCLCAYDTNDARLVDEVEGANHLISTHFEAFLAPVDLAFTLSERRHRGASR
jgi:hypothetical protein